MFRRLFFGGILLFSGFVDLPGHLSVGPISVSGAATILFSVVVAVLLARRRKLAWVGFRKIWPLSLLLLYSILQCLWRRPPMQGFQTVCILWLFVGLITVLAGGEKSELSFKSAERTLIWATAIATVCYTLSILYDGVGTEAFIGARSFALYALLGVALLLGRWANGSKDLWPAIGLTFIVCLSLSRTALVVAALLFPLAGMRSFSIRELRRVAVISLVTAVTLFLIIAAIGALSSRFLDENSVGDIASGEAELNTNGRFAFWAATMDSFSDSPWLGNGPGTANDLIDWKFEGLGHPHNEYLRVLHDQGILGLSLLLLGMGKLLLLCYRAYRESLSKISSSSGFCLATFLALTAFLLTMTTDNTASYVFVVSPLGILVGTALSSSTISVENRGLLKMLRLKDHYLKSCKHADRNFLGSWLPFPRPTAPRAVRRGGAL
jgi:O-antigen ligase